jgi:hypothetical protein
VAPVGTGSEVSSDSAGVLTGLWVTAIEPRIWITGPRRAGWSSCRRAIVALENVNRGIRSFGIAAGTLTAGGAEYCLAPAVDDAAATAK